MPINHQVIVQNSADKAFDLIRLAIVNGELHPSQRIIESQIAEKLGMSRSPVREALKRLETLGYLSRLSGGRLMVASHSARRTQNIFEIREALESMAIILACEHITEEQLNRATQYHLLSYECIPHKVRDSSRFFQLNLDFHKELFSTCGNDQLLSYIKIYSMDQFLYTRLSRVYMPRDWRRVVVQHGQILEAVRQRNPQRAEKAARKHVRTSLRIALERL